MGFGGALALRPLHEKTKVHGGHGFVRPVMSTASAPPTPTGLAGRDILINLDGFNARREFSGYCQWRSGTSWRTDSSSR